MVVLKLVLAISAFIIAIGCAGITGLLYSEAKYLRQSKEYTHGRLNALMSIASGAAALFMMLLALFVVGAI